MGEKKRINGLIDGEVVDGMAVLANRQRRSVTGAMEIILREALVKEGIIKPIKKAADGSN